MGMDPAEPRKLHLVLCNELEETNHSTIACISKEVLCFWLAKNRDEKFFLLFGNTAAYMINTAVSL